MKIRTSIKTGNPTFRQGLTVRSSLNFYNCRFGTGKRPWIASQSSSKTGWNCF